MSTGQLARQRSVSSGTRPAVRSTTPVTLPASAFNTEFEPCAATASIFLFAQGSSILCLHHDTLAIERRFERHKEQILLVSVDNVSERGAGRLVVSYDAGQTAVVWDLFTGDEIARFASYEHIRVAAWMKNGNVAFGNSQGNVILFEPSTSEHISARTIFDPITALAPAADCHTYAIGYMNGSILIVALQPSFTILHTLTTARAPSPIVNLSWHASSTKQKSDMLATQTSDGDLRVWSVAKPPTADSPKVIRVLKRGDNVDPGLNWIAWSKNGRIIQYSEGETWAWDVRTKHVAYEPIPTIEGVKALANYGATAALFTLGPNHTIQQYDLSPPALVKSVQYFPIPVPSPSIHPLGPQASQPQNKYHHVGAAAPMPIQQGYESLSGPASLSTIQRTVNEMQMVELAQQQRADAASPASTRSRSESVSSRSSGGPRYLSSHNPSISSRAASGTTFSTFSPVMGGHDSMYSGGSSVFPSSSVASGRRSKGSRLRQEVLRSPEPRAVDLFPYTRARLSSVPYTHPQPVDQANLTADDLRQQMLKIVFGWNGDIEPMIREELSHHAPGSTSAVLLSKWLGEVDVDTMATAVSSGNISSSDWMLLALSQMGGQASTSKLGQAFVQRLLQEGDVHTSATILLGLGDYSDAVEVYVSRNYYMEAILLTCLVFPTEWQRQAHLVRRWGEFVVENSQQQLAIRCFSCTGVDPPELWASPTGPSRSGSAQGHKMPRILSPPARVLSPPSSPPLATKVAPTTRMTAKTSALRLITSFGANEQQAPFKFPGLKTDDRTPTNAPGITPIAESAISPGGTPGGFLRSHSRGNSSLSVRTTTADAFMKHRLHSIGETPVDVVPPPFPRPSALPTPNDSGSDKERENHPSAQIPEEKTSQKGTDEPLLLLSSARYEPETPGRTPMTAMPATAVRTTMLPESSAANFAAYKERSRTRNASRDRKPDGLQIQMPSLEQANLGMYAASGGPFGGDSPMPRSDQRSNTWSALNDNGSVSSQGASTSDTRSPPATGQSWSSAKSPSVSGRSIDQYISSLDEAKHHSRKHKGESSRRHRSREDRYAGDGHREHKARSKGRVRESSEERGRGSGRRYIKPAKRSPSSPVPMSPEDLQNYKDSASTESLDGQLHKINSPAVGKKNEHGTSNHRREGKHRSGSKASEVSHTTTIRHISPDVFLDSPRSTAPSSNFRSRGNSRRQSPDGLLDQYGRGRSKSKNGSSIARSPSSPLPMSPQAKYYQRSEDEEDRLRLVEANRQRLRSRQRSASRRPRERGTSARRDISPDRRRLGNTPQTRQAPDIGFPAPQELRSPAVETQERRSSEETKASRLNQSLAVDRGLKPEMDSQSRRSSGENNTSHHQLAAAEKALKKEMAARELEARRESLARRPLAPAILHPTDIQAARPPISMRSKTDLGNSPSPWVDPSVSQEQYYGAPETPVGPSFSPFESRAASVGPYGLPATPRAMRHPRYDNKDSGYIPTVPEIPDGLGPLNEGFYHTGQPMRAPPRSILSHHSVSSGSGVGTINIGIDDPPTTTTTTNNNIIIDVPALPQSSRSPPPLGSASPPSSLQHRRGRSGNENLGNKIKNITERMRSTSRGRGNTKSPAHEQMGTTPSPYESVPPLYF
ncbi:WD40/YVTN repeat-like-containing domain [Lasallia pustulata]|uniref:WD40/YVTN repeat-like-containing domain n=1 Tax=Lasallia pustulata TaxID=136370 RepID=A0A1W5CZZ3_9LECA|nr:WD40/YVTN repeat-like-containing domain [Lasallia pustulata]